MPINYVIGDATQPQTDGTFVIAHCVNDIGAWGAGFVVPLGREYPNAKILYQRNFAAYKLGDCQIVPVIGQANLKHGYVANLFGQRGVGKDYKGRPAIRYQALWDAFDCLSNWLEVLNDSSIAIHMPRLGCGLAGGNWDLIGPMIESTFQGFPIFVYDLPEES